MRGRSLLTHGEVVAALVANRLSAPAPLYDVSGWAGQAAIAELLNVPASLLNDDRYGRALEAFCPVAEDLRGRLLLTTLNTFDVDATRLHLDLTTVRFAGGYLDSTLVRKGWGSDRQVARQVRALQASTPAGVALYLRPHWGSEAELTCPGQALETLQALTPAGLIVVADSAFGHLGNLRAPTARASGSSSRYAPTPAGPPGSTTTCRPGRWHCPNSTTSPTANATCHRTDAPAGAAGSPPSPPPTRTRQPARPTRRLHLVLGGGPGWGAESLTAADHHPEVLVRTPMLG